jgi:hypothetical protein
MPTRVHFDNELRRIEISGSGCQKPCAITGCLPSHCPCQMCRARRRKRHGSRCSCWLCYADRMGAFVDGLGRKTAPGRWVLFLTLTFRTRSYPWGRGFPRSVMPHPEFVHHFFSFMIRWLEDHFAEHCEYFLVDQFGTAGGRLHQHVGLSAPALVGPAGELVSLMAEHKKRLPEALKPFQRMLFDRAGMNRILPWELDAGYYIGRYIGRDAGRCDWNWKVGVDPIKSIPPIGRRVTVTCPVPDSSLNRYGEPSSGEYHKHLRRWHR